MAAAVLKPSPGAQSDHCSADEAGAHDNPQGMSSTADPPEASADRAAARSTPTAPPEKTTAPEAATVAPAASAKARTERLMDRLPTIVKYSGLARGAILPGFRQSAAGEAPARRRQGSG